MDTVENWKNYNKIIFKCVNSAVEPIFNAKIVEKWGLLVSWTVHKTHLCGWKVIEKSNCAAKAVFVLVSNHFQKCFSVNAGVWLCMENKFSRKYFQLTVCNGFDLEIGFSQNFHFKPFPDSRAKREREERAAFDFAGESRA